MSKNDDGEFELVLGNRQLVSVFFVVVILLGAFFMMGYVVGRTSSPTTTITADATNRAPVSGKPIIVDNGSRPAPQQPVEVDSSPQPAAKPIDPPPVETTKPSPAPPPDADAEARREKAKREQAKLDDAARAKRPAAPEAPAFQEPRVGQTFLQVAATSRADAEIVAESLAKRGFHTSLAPVPNSNLVRVLIGPVKDASDLAETRVRLEANSMKPMVRRY